MQHGCQPLTGNKATRNVKINVNRFAIPNEFAHQAELNGKRSIWHN